jgi:hypothetical protein
MDLAMGDTLNDVSSEDLAKMMEVVITYAPNNRRLDTNTDLPDNLSENMKKHIEWVHKTKTTIENLVCERNNTSDYYDEKRKKLKEHIDELKHLVRQYFYVMDIRFCPGCQTTFDPRENLGAFLTKIASDLRKIKNNEQSGKFAI